MGNEMKNVARGFKFLWATFSETMGNVFSRHGQCFLSLSVGCPWVVCWLSVGCACYPWVAPIGFTHGCVLITALRFLFCVGGWGIRGLSVGYPWVLPVGHPRLCSCHRAAVWVTHAD